MITLHNIEKSYQVGNRPLKVLKGIDLEVQSGELIAVMGSSGSGKSTLLNILGMLDIHDAGTYHLDGMPINNLSETKAARYRNQFLGFVFQSFNLIPFKSALENVALPLYYQKKSRKERQHLAMAELEKMGLTEWADHLPNQLSGGQKQRVAIARSLITQPKVLLADEPTGALDTQTSYEVLNIIKQVNREQGITVVLVTHEPDIAAMTQRIVKMKDGVIVEDAPVSPNDIAAPNV